MRVENGLAETSFVKCQLEVVPSSTEYVPTCPNPLRPVAGRVIHIKCKLGVKQKENYQFDVKWKETHKLAVTDLSYSHQ